MKFYRRHFITHFRYQLRYTGVILLALLFAFIVISSLIYWRLSFFLETSASGAFSPLHASHIAKELVKGLLKWMFILLLIVFFIGIYLSHKIVGPLERLENVMKRIAQGDIRAKVYLRDGDEFASLGYLINKAGEKIKDLNKQERKILEAALKETKQSKVSDLIKNVLEIKSFWRDAKSDEGVHDKEV